MHCVFLFERLSRRIGKHKACVTIARKLLAAVWHVLPQRELAHDVDVHGVASKLMIWAWRLTFNLWMLLSFSMVALQVSIETHRIQINSYVGQ
jgi:hypothetical protein